MSSFNVCSPNLPEGCTVDIKVRQGAWVYKGQMVAIIKQPKTDDPGSNPVVIKVKTESAGKVLDVLKKNGSLVKTGETLISISSECNHPTIMKNMCAECGADLQRDGMVQDPVSVSNASIAVLHSIPELKVSTDEAFHLGKQDEARLMKSKRLVLLVDLDQTLIHTTNENIAPNIKDVYHFQLYGPRTSWYHTRIRPGTAQFLETISKYFELHICTFGARLYAHTIANFLDPEKKYFSHRILSRDECFDNRSKTANMSSLFPCGDHMVCIIDDREDVWNFAPNLVHVKPYNFFKNTGDINAPPGFSKKPPASEESSAAKVPPKSENQTTEPKEKDFETKTEGSGDKYQRRDSIDMPTFDDDVSSNDEKVKDPKTVASADLEMSDDDSSKSSKSSDSDSSSSSSESSSNPDNGNGLKENSSKVNETEKKSDVEKVGGSISSNDAQVTSIKPEVEKTEKVVEKTEMVEAKTEKKAVKVEEQIKKIEEKTEEVKEKAKMEEEKTEKKEEKPEKNEEKTEKKEEKTEKKEEKTERKEEKTEKNEEKTENAAEKFDNVEETESELSKNSNDDDFVEMEDNDDYLMYLEDILKTIHKAYYDLYDQMMDQKKKAVPDLKNVIPYVKRKVIQGTNLVFSGVVPTNVRLEKSKPYMVAKSLGANMSDKITSQTTHLVAAKLGTAKVNEARKRGKIKLVTPDWLWACAERWEHVDERLFPLCKAASVTINPPAHCSSPEIAFSERCPPVPKEIGGEARMPETMNPFLAFSSEDLQGMDKEVEDILSGDSSSSSDEDEFSTSRQVTDNQSSSEDSLTGESRGHKRRRIDIDNDDIDGERQKIAKLDAVERFRRGEPVPQDFEIANQSDDDMEPGEDMEDGDWTQMGAALEREFLEDNSNSFQ